MKRRVAKTVSVASLFRMFPTDQDAALWFEQVRWNGKPQCAHCQEAERITVAKTKKYTYWCKACHKHFTATTGTSLHGAKVPPVNWIVTMYLMTTARKGISSLQLSKELGVTQKTAWFMLHRVRAACRAGDFQLSNIVEVDETYIGGKAKNKHQNQKAKKIRGTEGKLAVFGIRQRGGKTFAKPVSGTDRNTLVPEIERRVESGSMICTDDSGTYRELDPQKYYHDSVRHSAGEYVKGFVHTNGMESVWAVLKRSLIGTYHHVSFKHLHRYVNEATFRLNDGNCDVDTMDRLCSMTRAIEGRRLSYKDLVQ